MMLRLTVDIPDSLPEGLATVVLIEAASSRQGITITTPEGTKMDVDLINVDVVPEGRLIQ